MITSKEAIANCPCLKYLAEKPEGWPAGMNAVLNSAMDVAFLSQHYEIAHDFYTQCAQTTQELAELRWPGAADAFPKWAERVLPTSTAFRSESDWKPFRDGMADMAWTTLRLQEELGTAPERR